MSDIQILHESILREFGLKYFQSCDYNSIFPSDYFNQLKKNNALYHLITDYESANLFSCIASAIGRYSISASICWVMHNQQINIIHKLSPEIYERILFNQSLIASATSEDNKGGNNNLYEEDNKLRLIRSVPVCSYRYDADFFVVSMRCKHSFSLDRNLVLLPKEYIKFTDGYSLSSNKSTSSGPIEIDAYINNDQIIGSLSTIFSSIFVPIAHIGWMSSYCGGLTGILSRIRNSIREKNSNLNKKSSDTLFRNRLSQIIALEYNNRCIIQDCLSKSYNISGGERKLSLNIVKTEVSKNIRKASHLIEDVLGSKYIITPFDEFGAEIFCRDAKSASLMIHNDIFYQDIFDLWILKTV
ncbi:hypothetical protein ID850_15080 [Xenorhabdus sp. Flor]|uniref:hypothetical protein n=1 Tax=Xenorhabdus cabanillasii TaxID=351673 RepID=UPI0019C4F1AA|nr:hypothetical protein [Xenorhabdus sp. Flor]MBD2816052.1 hypothetical protein [Xenorhabdus sp. Flor]